MEGSKKNILLVIALIIVVALFFMMRSKDASETPVETDTTATDEQQIDSLNTDLDAEFKVIDQDASTL
jgi:Na+/H+ antiporter NhaB